jgi:hypothetical protein
MMSLAQRLRNLEKKATSTKKSILQHILEEIDGTTRGLPCDRGETLSTTISRERLNELLKWAAATPYQRYI